MAGDPLSDHYQMLEELGSGSFGTVYKAIDKATGEIVAVKHIDLESTDEDLQEVQAEISLLSTCASPFVTQYRASFLRGYKLWIVMEYLGGGSCQDLLKPGVFSEAHISIVCQQILLGLQYLHQEGKLHRDIKAANILLSQSGKVKLADFGVAAQLVNIRSLRNTFVGTPFWMAPEVIQQSGYDFKADIWSLGITAIELIHGEPPNAGKHPMKVLMEIPKMPAPRLEGSQYSKDFRDFIAKCLIKDPDQRPSARELLKHRFIRNAGRTEALQELILRRQEWEARLEKKETLRYYAETMRNIKVRGKQEEGEGEGDDDDDDGWVFDTVKAVPTLHPTQKRRKLTTTKIGDGVREDETKEMEEMEVLPQQQQKQQHIESSTTRRVPDPPLSPTSSVKRSTKKRISSGQQKQPLGVNMSFGNSPSTVRQFRRVSPTSIENDRLKNDEALAHSSLSPSKLRNRPQQTALSTDAENMPPPAIPGRNPAQPSSRNNSLSRSTSSTAHTDRTSSTTSSLKPSPSPSPSPSKQPTPIPSPPPSLSHDLYTLSIAPTIQSLLTSTTQTEQFTALTALSTALSHLHTSHPSALPSFLTGVLTRCAQDPALATHFLPPVPARPLPLLDAPSLASETDTELAPAAGAGTAAAVPGAGRAKLVLAQNNPHLKSHHQRRQSRVLSQPAPAPGKERECPLSPTPSPHPPPGTRQGRDEVDVDDEEEDRRESADVNVNVKGMEHVQGLAEVLFERWCEGLGGRWGGVGCVAGGVMAHHEGE